MNDRAELDEFAQRYAKAWCSQNPESVPAFFAERGSISINNGPPAVGRTAIAKEAQAFMTTFPDMIVTFDKLEPREGAVAVVISLIYVAMQIRQNTNAVRSATAQTVDEHFAKWYHLVAADAELSRIVANGLRDYASLAEQERVRFVAAFMAFLSYSQNAFLKWREGLLAQPLWRGWELVIMNLVCAPGGKAFWKDRAYMFGDQFRRYVESDLMTREPHPDAKPMGAFSIGGVSDKSEAGEPVARPF